MKLLCLGTLGIIIAAGAACDEDASPSSGAPDGGGDASSDVSIQSGVPGIRVSVVSNDNVDVPRGGTRKFTFLVSRFLENSTAERVQGPIAISLQSPPAGFNLPPVEIPAGGNDQGEAALTVGAEAAVGSVTVVFRATAKDNPSLTAEALGSVTVIDPDAGADAGADAGDGG